MVYCPILATWRVRWDTLYFLKKKGLPTAWQVKSAMQSKVPEFRQPLLVLKSQIVKDI